MRAVIERTKLLENLEVWPETFSIDLLTFEGRCRGRTGEEFQGQSPVQAWPRVQPGLPAGPML